jgi:hypothetical protein
LISSLHNDKKCLDDIKIVTGNKSRKLSKTNKENIIKYILQEEI